nr:MAG TPA: hypothetical protein [Caudoviricetes sp.]
MFCFVIAKIAQIIIVSVHLNFNISNFFFWGVYTGTKNNS